MIRHGTEDALVAVSYDIADYLRHVVPATVLVQEAEIVRSPDVPLGVVQIHVRIHGQRSRPGFWQRLRLAWNVLLGRVG